MQNEIDTLRMVRKMWKHFAPGDMYHIDYNTGCMSLRPEGILLLQASVDALDALIARLSSEKLVSERSEQARMEKGKALAEKCIHHWLGGGDGMYKSVYCTKCNAPHPDTNDCYKSSSPHSAMEQNTGGDVEALVGKISEESTNGLIELHRVKKITRAHFNAAAAEKGE